VGAGAGAASGNAPAPHPGANAGGISHAVALRGGGGLRTAQGSTRRTQQQALDFMLDLVDG